MLNIYAEEPAMAPARMPYSRYLACLIRLDLTALPIYGSLTNPSPPSAPHLFTAEH